MSSQISPFPSEDHQSFILEIMEAQRRPRDDEQRDPGWLASILAKIPFIPRFGPACQIPHEQRPYSMAFKLAKIFKSVIDHKTGHDQSKQNEVNEFRSKGKQSSILASQNSSADPHGSYENHIESNGHKTTTRKGNEPVTAENPSHSEEAAACAICGYLSTVPVTSEPAALETAAPPVAEKNLRRDVKKVADDCYVDLARSLSSDTQLAWETKIHPWLETNLLHSLDDLHCISAECVMAGIRDGGPMDPTILFMCRNLAQKQTIGRLLDRCPFIPRKLQRRIIVIKIFKCTSAKLGAYRPNGDFRGREMAIHFDHAHSAHVLYANVARIIPIASYDPTVFCTIGGMLTVNGTFYGLTTAHPLADFDDRRRATPTVTPALTILGRVAYSQWPNSAQGEDNWVKPIHKIYSAQGEDNRVKSTNKTYSTQGDNNRVKSINKTYSAQGEDNRVKSTNETYSTQGEDNRVKSINKTYSAQGEDNRVKSTNETYSTQGEDNRVKSINETYSRGEDWALVEFGHPAMTCNTFQVPGAGKPQKVTGYVKTTDLGSGEVWICAGVSGVQLGYLKHHPASIMMSESLFSVRSISLERPLVDGDSGSWVVRDEKLCGLIFCRTGNGLEWAYMLPIEAVLDSISDYWRYLHPGLPWPEVKIAGDEVVDAATNTHEIVPEPEDNPRLHSQIHENPSSPNQEAMTIVHSFR